MLLLLNWVVTNAKNFGQFRKLYVAVWNILCELYQDRGTGSKKMGTGLTTKITWSVWCMRTRKRATQERVSSKMPKTNNLFIFLARYSIPDLTIKSYGCAFW